MMLHIRNSFRLFIELSKVRIALLAAFSAAAGFVAAAGRLSSGIIAPVSGIFFLACGALSLNQYQERYTDALMDRTRSRPLPSGRVKPVTVISFSLLCIAAGFLLLFFFVGLWTACTGLFAVFWYNAVYLLIKRRNAFASIPGSITGAVPPLAGFEAGGGHVTDPRLLVLMVFMVVWQIPHFWLIVMKYGKDYEKARLPSLSRVFTKRQLSRITFLWVASTAMISFMMPLYGIISLRTAVLLLFPFTVVLLWYMARLLIFNAGQCPRKMDLIAINLYASAIILICILDRIVAVV
ncbi:MAG: UbiA family prenyltransferase [Deltaproteobacteria bacterium]|nr:UbiA family prenyltransferase [Deltaproteobacteria bacterium]MCL5277222.1 UbiA family prenyltransferase [Deltaproteobacteria bacterium]